MTFKLTKMSYLSHVKDKKVCLRRVWIRLKFAYLLCAREFRQNNALALQFWCLSNALTLRVCALDAPKSQHACIILSKFTRKSKYAVIDLYSYTTRTRRACCSQSKFRILKICKSSARALFLYNCTPNISCSACVSVGRVDLRKCRVDLFSKGVITFC